VRDDFEDAQTIFLTPNQLDVFLNISSLHEMRMDQVRYYFEQIERLTRNYFYFKQWEDTTVTFENETISEADYPIVSDWTLLNRQQCKVQAKFFEALYELPASNSDLSCNGPDMKVLWVNGESDPAETGSFIEMHKAGGNITVITWPDTFNGQIGTLRKWWLFGSEVAI
jgi:hypothetical protein